MKKAYDVIAGVVLFALVAGALMSQAEVVVGTLIFVAALYIISKVIGG